MTQPPPPPCLWTHWRREDTNRLVFPNPRPKVHCCVRGGLVGELGRERGICICTVERFVCNARQEQACCISKCSIKQNLSRRSKWQRI